MIPRLPRFLVACDDCWDNAPEMSCFRPEEIAWSAQQQKWLCNDCWVEFSDEEKTVPLVYAKDLIPDDEDQRRALVRVMAASKMGVR